MAEEDIDQDALYWNAYTLLHSSFLKAKKKLLLLTLAQDQLNTRRVAAILVAYGGLSFSDGMSQNRTSGSGRSVALEPLSGEDIPHPVYVAHGGLCSDSSGLGALIEEGLGEVGWEDVLAIVRSHPTSKLHQLLEDTLDWSWQIDKFWRCWRELGVPDAETLEGEIAHAARDFELLLNNRPRLLYSEFLGSKLRPVEVKYFRADLTDLPFLAGDESFFLLSKFAEKPVIELLRESMQVPPPRTAISALVAKYQGLAEHIAVVVGTEREDEYIQTLNMAEDASSHPVRLFTDLPNDDVPFGLAVVDVCRSEHDPVNIAGLYQSLQCLAQALVQKGTTHIFTVLTGLGPQSAFAAVSVETVLTELRELIRRLAATCRSLQRVTVATINPSTATAVREFLSGGRTVPEDTIDRLKGAMATHEEWLRRHELMDAARSLVAQAQQSGQRKEYHRNLCAEMRQFVGHYVCNFLLEVFGVREAYAKTLTKRYGAEVHVMAGQAAEWMKSNAAVIARSEEDQRRLREICKCVTDVNSSYVNPGMHPESLTEDKLHDMEGSLPAAFDRLLRVIQSSSNWTPERVDGEVLQQLAPTPASPDKRDRGGSPSKSHPTMPDRDRSESPTKGQIVVQPRSGAAYSVSSASIYVVNGSVRPVCGFFCRGDCRHMGTCADAHPCRFGVGCRTQTRGCVFDHPHDPKKPICRFFVEGRCHMGLRCRFAHPAGRSS
ncbi:unnamed protein product [Symbiodinium natans]|uniref:C3H1-type domain-containing protein n=1 Tax=Symbiodinium natans TaxID=878477 RepID=A0A812JLV6_9DINO|nr:unnamed protein product [Symbiodinium natans]